MPAASLISTRLRQRLSHLELRHQAVIASEANQKLGASLAEMTFEELERLEGILAKREAGVDLSEEEADLMKGLA
jgi:phage shock protein A